MIAEPGDTTARRPAATVARLVRRNYIWLAPDDSLLEAFQLMRLARLRLLPVVREGILVGVLSFRDLNRALLEELLGTPDSDLEAILVESVMQAPGPTIGPEELLVDAATSLCRVSMGCLPVVEPALRGLRLLGVVTESDLLRAAYFGPGARPG